MNKNFIKYRGNPNLDLENIVSKSNSFYENIKQRKTIREFSKKTFLISVIENCIKLQAQLQVEQICNLGIFLYQKGMN